MHYENFYALWASVLYHDLDDNDDLYGLFSSHHIPASLTHNIGTAAGFGGLGFQGGDTGYTVITMQEMLRIIVRILMQIAEGWVDA
jgi:hypothetical protein